MTNVIDSLGQNIVKEPKPFYNERPHNNGDKQNTPKHWTTSFKKLRMAIKILLKTVARIMTAILRITILL